MKAVTEKIGRPTPVRGRVLFPLSLVLLFWNGPLFFDVYSVAPVGAVFEALWLPMLTGLFFLPVFSLVLRVRRRYAIRSPNFYSLLLFFLTVAVLLYRTATGV